MTYEIITSRWVCQDCGGPLRLVFAQSAPIEADAQAEEYVCDRVFCPAGHPMSEEYVQEVTQGADEEFYAAMERGAQIGQIWLSPTFQDATVPNEGLPPEE